MRVICPDGFTVNDVQLIIFQSEFYPSTDGGIDVVFVLCCFTSPGFDCIQTTFSTCFEKEACDVLWSFRQAKESGLEVWEVPGE